MQVPILNGIVANSKSDFRTTYPCNYIPVPKETGIAAGYLRPADGIVQLGTGPGIDRGAINWNGVCFRVMGSKLCSIAADGSMTLLGDVDTDTLPVTMDYAFNALGIASNGKLFYWTGSSLIQVTDPDLGTVVDIIWVDGYFMSTDGTNLIVTELNDLTQVNPLKYGSAEADPDLIVALLKLRNEVYAMGRYTIQVFQNVGGDFFPFAPIEGAYMQRGAIGTHACTVFQEALAFVGGGRNEAPAVWIGNNGQTAKISTREIDQVLREFSEDQLSKVTMEDRVTDGHQFLYIHLPDRTLVYDGAGSQVAGEPIWFVLSSGVAQSQYRARHFVWCYDRWLCGDPQAARHGFLSDEVSSHYGEVVGWDFGTAIVYNGGMGAIFHEIELVCLSGNAAFGAEPIIWTSYSIDGINWSQEKARTAGKFGERLKRLNWLCQGSMRNWRVQRFRGTSDAHMAVARLEIRLEALNV